MATEGKARAGQNDTEEESHWQGLAREHWRKAITPKKVRSDIIEKEIWDVLALDDFAFSSLQQLESLLLLEKLVAIRRIWENTHDGLAICGRDSMITLRTTTSSSSRFW